MRGKRSKQYRKLMQQYGLSFGFREPYQVLVDADIVKDAERYKMDLIGGLERILHGKIKPMITQCCMRHLYASASEPGMTHVIDRAKIFERRRCDHRPEEYTEPLSAVECISSVVDPKGSKTNRHRYVVASQHLDVRKVMRDVMGVPLVYINRSVMIMEPMAGATAKNREREERGKFKAGLKPGRASGSQGMKRKREDVEEETDLPNNEDRDAVCAAKQKKAYGKGPKGPNPLAVKKSKKKAGGKETNASPKLNLKVQNSGSTEAAMIETASETGIKRKRRRKHKSGVEEGGERGSMTIDEEHIGSPRNNQ